MTVTADPTVTRTAPQSRPGRLLDPDDPAHRTPLPLGVDPALLLAEVTRSGLTGRGGAAFPLARKLESVRRRRGQAVVVGNAAEGEPGSRKDATLLSANPQLVLDGLAVAAHLTGAGRALLAVPGAQRAARLARLAADRRDAVTVEVVEVPEHFLTGQESALVSRLSGGAGLPTGRAAWQSGVRGAPTAVSNVETLAHLAVVARSGAQAFRTRGTTSEPGTMLVTVDGAVEEVELGVALTDLLPRSIIQAVLVGGYHGAWLPAVELPGARLSRESLGSIGAGVLLTLPEQACGLAETARIVRWLAERSARQCGPCTNGLPALAATLERLASAGRDAALATRAAELADAVTGRGACAHPDGTARLVRSALQTFATEVGEHGRGRCRAPGAGAGFPYPPVTGRVQR